MTSFGAFVNADGTNAYAFLTPDSGLQAKALHPARGVAPSDLRPLRKILDCSLPQESGQCLSPSVGGHPLRSPNRHSLGGPLPHQQADSA